MKKKQRFRLKNQLFGDLEDQCKSNVNDNMEQFITAFFVRESNQYYIKEKLPSSIDRSSYHILFR